MAGNRWHAEEDEGGFIRTLYKVVGQLKKTHKEQRLPELAKSGKLIPPLGLKGQQMEEGLPELNKI